MMKHVVVGLVALLCMYFVNVSDALETVAGAGAGIDSDHLKLAQDQEATAIEHVAEKEYGYAARCYTEAANHYYLHTRTQQREGDSQGAARSYKKSAAMHKEAGVQERKHVRRVLTSFMAVGEGEQMSFMGLPADYAEMGKYRQQSKMHESAAVCYAQMADEQADSLDPMNVNFLNLAAALQYEASAKCAQASGDAESAMLAYSHAADYYAAVSDEDSETAMRVAAVMQQKALTLEQAAYGAGAACAMSLLSMALGCEAQGDPDMARTLHQAVVVMYEANTIHLGHSGRDAHRHGDMAEVYETLGRPEKAGSLWRTAAELYGVAAEERARRNDKAGASSHYRAAVAIYEKMGEHDKAGQMRDAMMRR